MVRIDSFNVFLLFLTTFVLLIVAYHRKALLFSTCIYSSQHAHHSHQHTRFLIDRDVLIRIYSVHNTFLAHSGTICSWEQRKERAMRKGTTFTAAPRLS